MKNDFMIHQDETLLNAMAKIDKNKENFLIVFDDKKRVVATLSDGDIRRYILQDRKVDAYVVDAMNRHFDFLDIDDDFKVVAEKFKKSKIKFLPILKDKYLKNILTKKNFHSMLLEDNDFDLEQNFDQYNHKSLEHEIYNRPWGFYKSTFYAEFSQSKIITVFPKEELSLQEHKQREEHWIIVKGEGCVILGESIINVYAGSYIYIPKGVKHQIINKDTSKNLIFAEVQLGDYFGEDDIIRYSDKYGRV